MFRFSYVYLLAILSFTSFLGATMIDTIVLEKELADGSRKRVVFWGDLHLSHAQAQEQLEALDEMLEYIKAGANRNQSVTENTYGICDETGCSTDVLSITVLLENYKRKYEDWSDFDWELCRCLVSLMWKIDFSKDDRSGLFTWANKPSSHGNPSFNLDKNKVGEEGMQWMMAMLHMLDKNGYTSDSLRFEGVMKKLQELSEVFASGSSLIIEPIDTRMVGIYTALGVLGAGYCRARSIDDRPASKVFGTCAAMSLTLIDLIDKAIEELDCGRQQSRLLHVVLQSHDSGSEIDEFVALTSSVIDYLTALRNVLVTIPALRDSNLFNLIHIFIDRKNMVTEDDWEEKTFREKFFDAFPESKAIEEKIDQIIDENELPNAQRLSGLFLLSLIWQLDAEIIQSVLASDGPDLVLVATGDGHAVHCAQLLENEGYETVFSTTPFLPLEKYIQYLDLAVKAGSIDPVDGATLKSSVLDSRSELEERHESHGDTYRAREDLMERFGFIDTEDPESTDEEAGAPEEVVPVEEESSQKEEL